MHRGLLCAGLVAVALLAPSARAGDLPDKGWIVWASDRESSRHEIYLMKADGSGIQRLTSVGAKAPAWSPDGAWIAYCATTEGATRAMRRDGSDDRELCEAGLTPWFWMHDGSGLVCGGGNSYTLADPNTLSKTPLFKKTDFPRLGDSFWPGGMTRDGRWLVGTTDRINTTYPYDNGTFTSPINAAVVLDFTDKQKIYFLGNGCEPTASPVEDLVVHVNWDSPTFPDIFRMRLADLASRSSYAPEMNHPDADWGHEYMPRLSTDGKWLTYGATTGCQNHDACDYEIFVHPIGAAPDRRTRVTSHPGSDQWAHLYVGDLWDRANPPRLALVVAGLSFEAEEGGAAPSEQRLAARNEGGGTLAPLRITVRHESAGSWLSARVEGVGNDQVVVTACALAGLAPGSYQASVEVSTSGASGARSAAITLTVKPRTAPVTPPAGGWSAAPGGGPPARGATIVLVVLVLLVVLSRSTRCRGG